MKFRIFTSILFFTIFSFNSFGLGCTTPSITSQPSSAIVCLGGTASFSITATGPSLVYQWQVDQGSGFVNLSNVAPYSGVTTSTLTITGVTMVLSDYVYRCVVSNGCIPNAVSFSVILKVNVPPTIYTQPVNSAICLGDNSFFAVTASGSSLSYQWQVNTGSGFVNVPAAAPYTGDTTATLYITGATAGMNGYVYQCIITGDCPPAITTTSATLTINAIPAITVQPTNATVCEGGSASFSVTATGTGLTYQWQVDQGSGYFNLIDSAVYSGVSTSVVSITGATIGMNGYSYQCVISGACATTATTSYHPLIVHPTYLNYKPVTICQGDSTIFGGSYYNEPGLYPHLFSSAFGCDSLVYLSLNVSSAYLSTTTSSICDGDSILIGGIFRKVAGTYTYILPTISGCDSTIENTLTVHLSYHFSQSATICEGDSVLIFGTYEKVANAYFDNYTTYLGCDSIYAFNLFVNPVYNNTVNAGICSGDSLLIAGAYESVAGTYTHVYASVSGCDSTITTVLAVHPVSSSFQAASICSNDSIFLGGAYQHSAGTYTDNLTSIFGCDSTVVTTLAVTTAPNVTLDFSSLPLICSFSSPFVLTAGSPAGGTYSGVGVSGGNLFTPSASIIGTWGILYTYSDSVGCSVSAVDSIVVSVCGGIAELMSDNDFSVYPNPFADQFTISSTFNTPVHLTIINVLGETVHSQIIKTGNTQINMSSMAKGIYFIKINDAFSSTSKKIIKE